MGEALQSARSSVTANVTVVAMDSESLHEWLRRAGAKVIADALVQPMAERIVALKLV